MRLRVFFSSFDIMLLHLKLQTCFVLPELLSTIDCTEESRKDETCLQIKMKK